MSVSWNKRGSSELSSSNWEQFQGHVQQSSAQFGQTTSRNQFWLLKCLMQNVPKPHSPPFPHTPPNQTRMPTLSWAFLPSIFTHWTPLSWGAECFRLPIHSWVNGEDLCGVNHLLHCTSSLSSFFFVIFCLFFFSLRCKWIFKIILSFQCRVMGLENHSIAILLILFFSHFTWHILPYKISALKKAQTVHQQWGLSEQQIELLEI